MNEKVIKSKNIYNRYVISDENDKIIDDAQGYGYKTYKSATKAMLYKFGDLKNKIIKTENEIKELLKIHPSLNKYIEKLLESYCKELYRNEITIDFIKNIVEREFNIKLTKHQFKYLLDN